MVPKVVRAIAGSGLSIYDSLVDHPHLLIDTTTLQRILNKALVGLDLDFPIRTRSKVLKGKVCEALGYPIPAAFRRCRPRFPGQDFDTYVQKANNLQIWNQEVSASRRYVLIRVDAHQVVRKVRVVSGEVIAQFDRTGTLTRKYQAKSREVVARSCLVSENDTPLVTRRLFAGAATAGLLPIREVYERLARVVGKVFPDPGRDQERNRGWALHQAVCRQLGMRSPSDVGQFPDVPDQLLEIKLQTASTIDLGLVCPDSTEPMADVPGFRHCDVRYAVFYASIGGPDIRLDHLVLTTGADFFRFFRRFEGNVRNAKIQLHLPADFFG